MADDGTPASDVLSGLAGEFVAAPDSVAREMVRGHRRALADAMSASEVSDAARRALAAGNKDLALQIFERAFVATAPTAVSIAEAWDDLARAHSPEMRKLVMTVGACGSPVELKRVIIANEDKALEYAYHHAPAGSLVTIMCDVVARALDKIRELKEREDKTQERKVPDLA